MLLKKETVKKLFKNCGLGGKNPKKWTTFKKRFFSKFGLEVKLGLIILKF